MSINGVFIYLCVSDAATRLDLLKCRLLRRYFSSYINVPGQTSTLWILLILDAELKDDLSRLEAGAQRMVSGWLGGRGADRGTGRPGVRPDRRGSRGAIWCSMRDVNTKEMRITTRPRNNSTTQIKSQGSSDREPLRAEQRANRRRWRGSRVELI